MFIADFGEAVCLNIGTNGKKNHSKSSNQRHSTGADISIASSENRHALTKQCRGTMYVQSPEMLSVSTSSSTGKTAAPSSSANTVLFEAPNQSSDIWALGCLLYELLLGSPLFADRPWPDLFLSLCRSEFHLPDLKKPLSNVLEGYDPKLCAQVESIMISALNQNANSRPSIR